MRSVTTVMGASRVPSARGQRANVFALSLATASAVLTVLVSSVTLAGGDKGSVVEGGVPTWLRSVAFVAAAVMVAGAWAVRVHHPRASAGLAVATVGSLLPLWAAWSLLPGAVRAGVLAAAPFTVAGTARVALGWPPQASGSTRRVGRTVVVLVAAASLAHLLGYNPFADPGCARTCDDVRPFLESVLATKSAVAITCVLTIVAAILAAAAILRGSPPYAPRGVIGAVTLALGLLAASLALRWARWGATTASLPLLVVEPLAVAVVGAVLCGVGIRTAHTRAAVDRLGTRLSNPETALRDLAGAIRGMQFAVPGEARWVDVAGRDVGDAPAQGSYVVLSDASGPVVRLLLAGRADQGELLAGLTPVTRLALRNAQLVAVAKSRLADVQASQRRVVAMSDAERRRIERDLHDGAQQRLVSVAFHLRVALAGVDPATAVELMSTEARVREALAHLRQLAHGIFPSVLANEGLEAALDELVAASDVPAALDIRVGNLDADAAMVAYATVAAALESVEHPSTATQVAVSAVQDGDTLTVRVTVDSGVQTTAAAFTDVADRVGALGGRFTLSDAASDGTVVTAVIPCAS
jgi:signal transduction histidine kinase